MTAGDGAPTDGTLSGAALARVRGVNDFAGELRQLMAERGVGVRELSRRAHYNASYISRLASGKKKPSRQAAELCDEALSAKGKLTAYVPAPPAEPAASDGGIPRGHADVHIGSVGSFTVQIPSGCQQVVINLPCLRTGRAPVPAAAARGRETLNGRGANSDV